MRICVYPPRGLMPADNRLFVEGRKPRAPYVPPWSAGSRTPSHDLTEPAYQAEAKALYFLRCRFECLHVAKCDSYPSTISVSVLVTLTASHTFEPTKSESSGTGTMIRSGRLASVGGCHCFAGQLHGIFLPFTVSIQIMPARQLRHVAGAFPPVAAGASLPVRDETVSSVRSIPSPSRRPYILAAMPERRHGDYMDTRPSHRAEARRRSLDRMTCSAANSIGRSGFSGRVGAASVLHP